MKHGDLLYTQIGNIDVDAIAAVTEGIGGALLNHVGVVIDNNWGRFVLEAFHPEVRVTSLAVHLRRSQDQSGLARYVVQRLKPAYANLIPSAVAYGLKQRDVPYDDRYLTDQNALYCSELVVDMFAEANAGAPFFPERPMSFRDKVTGEIHPAWVSYYERFGMDVPDGEPGSNPGALSLDDRLDLVMVRGPIVGWRGVS